MTAEAWGLESRVVRGRRLRRLILLTACATAICLVMAPVSQAASPWQRTQTKGQQRIGSCISAQVCVIVGGELFHGDVIPVKNGRPIQGRLYRSTAVVYDVSCVRGSGCIALAQPCERSSSLACQQVGQPARGRPGAILFRISRTGRSVRTIELPLPPGMSLGHLACTALDRCLMSGLDVASNPMRVDLAFWNGRKLAIHHVFLPKGAEDGYLTHVACSGATCETVGYENNPAVGQVETQGYIVTTRNGVPIRTSFVGASETNIGFQLEGVGCVSAGQCYAAAYTIYGSPAVIPITDGIPGSPIYTTNIYNAIACEGSTCTLAGYATPEGSSYAYEALGELSNGKLTAETYLPNVGAFISVTMADGQLMAVDFNSVATTYIVSGAPGSI